MIGLRAIGTAVPGWRVGNDVISEWTGMDESFIGGKLGIEERAYLGEGETLVGLARAACDDLFTRAPELDPASVGLVVLVTQNPDFRLPHSSALLQRELGLPTSTACFDVNLGCSGYVYALSVARGFMASEEIDEALVVTCDPYSRIMGRGDRDTVALFGDAATATWLSASGGAPFGRADCGTDGTGAERLIVRAGGSAAPVQGLAAPAGNGTVELPAEGFRLRMHGRSIFNFMMEKVPLTIEACLAKNGLAEADVDLYVFHQASKYMLDKLSDRLGLEPERVPRGMARVGNTVSSSIPLLLADLGDRGELAGRTVLASGFGVGLSWASNVIYFGKGS